MPGDRAVVSSRLLFFLAADAGAGPRDGVESRLRVRLAAVAADAEGADVDAVERLFDRLEDLGVGLFQFQLDVDFVVPARLIGHVALASGVVLHGPLERLWGGAPGAPPPLSPPGAPGDCLTP